ncbi:MAG: hypothetical protein ACFFDW_12900 [Candidatus Thorarchaeota archaeon]
MKNRILTNILVLPILFLCISLTFFSPLTTISQANLVEEQNHYKIFSGNFFELTILKTERPNVKFDVDHFGSANFDFNYISEYYSSSVFMNSLSNLDGKGYSFSYLDWNTLGFSDNNFTTVNFNRNNLDRNSSIDVTYTIFNKETEIYDYTIKPLEQLFISLNISNWQYTYGTRGIALNIIASFTSSENYYRLGPYIDFITDSDYVKIISNENEFQVEFKPQINVKTKAGIWEKYEAMVFANYNIKSEEAKPADFWISVPYRYDISQLIFTFVCSFEINHTENTSLNAISIVIFSFSIMVIVYRRFVRK